MGPETGHGLVFDYSSSEREGKKKKRLLETGGRHIGLFLLLVWSYYSTKGMSKAREPIALKPTSTL